MSVKLIKTFNKALNETTVSAHDASGMFICCATQSGRTARVEADLRKQVGADADRIQRAEKASPRYHLVDVPGMTVQSLAFPTC